MPVEDLIRYFNAADRDGDSLLYPRQGQVEAWHAGVRLFSRFEPIVDLCSERIVGHRASLHGQRENGEEIGSEAIYALCEQENSVVYIDRLCRTLHALNFLAQQRTTGGFLQVQVHPRHLLAVPSQHGLVYEAILKRCGLSPEDIVLELAAGAIDADGHFTQALQSYRQRGYQLALRLDDASAPLDKALALQPDVIRLAQPLPDFALAAQQAGIVCQQGAVADAEALRAACQQGLSQASGALFGAPAASCQPTHSGAVKPYNSSSLHRIEHENRQ